jgi:hypothetical protein
VEPFASPAELATYLQSATQVEADAGSGDVLETGVATQALAAASGAIRAACGWSISQETVSGPVTWATGSCVFLPTLYLTAVSLMSGGLALVDGADFTWSQNGLLRRSALTRYWLGSVEITYTHGYATIPDAVKAVCLERAAQQVVNPLQMVSATVGGVSDVYRRAEAGSDLVSDPRLAPFMLPAIG